MPIHSFTYSSDSICDLWLRMVFPHLWRELWGSTKVPMIWHLFHEVFSHQKQKGITIHFCGRGITSQMQHQSRTHASFASYTDWTKQTFQVKHWRNWFTTRVSFGNFFLGNVFWHEEFPLWVRKIQTIEFILFLPNVHTFRAISLE